MIGQFQFLIGTIKTYTAGEGEEHETLFQFLIGTIKTELQLEQMQRYNKCFNSL